MSALRCRWEERQIARIAGGLKSPRRPRHRRKDERDPFVSALAKQRRAEEAARAEAISDSADPYSDPADNEPVSAGCQASSLTTEPSDSGVRAIPGTRWFHRLLGGPCGLWTTRWDQFC